MAGWLGHSGHVPFGCAKQVGPHCFKQVCNASDAIIRQLALC